MLRRGGNKDYLTLLSEVTYLGSHPTVVGHHEGLAVVFYRDRLSVRDSRKRENVHVPWGTVSKLAALDRHHVENSVSLSRVALLGVFAFAGKGKPTAYLEVVDASGTWLFAVPGLTAVELEAGLMPIRSRYLPHLASASPREPGAGAPVDPASRLRQLDELRAAGLIDDAEYQSRRAVILDSI